MMKALVVDDDRDVRAALAEILGAEAFEVVTVADGQAALDHVASDPPALVVLDLVIPGLDGMEVLRRLKTIAPHVRVIVVTDYGTTASAVQAMKLGADDYLTKPLQRDELVAAARQVLGPRRLGTEIDAAAGPPHDDASLHWLMGPSRQVQEIIQQIRQVADSTFTILIQGETGTGKELVARAIHQMSSRRDKPFVTLDCRASPGTVAESEYFERAEGGSLFFDEIVSLPPATQAKLLRVTEERRGPRREDARAPLDVRILAAFSVSLVEELRTGRFRQDLYYRLNEFVIVLPPLRKRPDDIPHLAKRFLTEASLELRRPVSGISDEAIDFLVRYPWPGNVRELRNVIRRAVLLTPDLVRPEHLVGLIAESPAAAPASADLTPPAGLSLREIAASAAAEAERRAIRQTLRATRGRKSEAARRLKTDYKTLYVKMKKYKIYTRDFLS